MRLAILIGLCLIFLSGCDGRGKQLELRVIRSSAMGERLREVSSATSESALDTLEIFPNQSFQTMLGFGGAFTETSAHLYFALSESKRKEILTAYFGDEGAKYSLTRTHMNSCDFSLSQYSYAPIAYDTNLVHFNIKPDQDDLLPMIKEAAAFSTDGFKLIASPWTAPPWMKTNNAWFAGSLKPQFYSTWAKYFRKYAEAYAAEGVNIWGFTVENEPLGNDSNWESMHYTPHTMGDFIKNHLGPELRNHQMAQHLLIYDQNRGKELEEWASALLTDQEVLDYIYGTAVHWYASTYDFMPESLEFTHQLAPDKHIIHTEGCVDAEKPHWQDDAWYWREEATDWGWDWAKPEDKALHPKYTPVFRYANDIIGCMNNWVEGWIDWNMVLDQNGGPNHASNWCVAPIIVDTNLDEIYITPIYDVMVHFSKYIQPGDKRIGMDQPPTGIMATAVRKLDGSIVMVATNSSEEAKTITLKLKDRYAQLTLPAYSIQSILTDSIR